MIDELKKLLDEKLAPSLHNYGKIAFSLDESFEEIVQMIIEQQKLEVDLSDLTDEEIRKELEEILTELKDHIKKNKYVCERLCEVLRLVPQRIERLKIKDREALETMVQLNNTLTEGLISEVVAELEILRDEFRAAVDQDSEKYVSFLISYLEEMVDRTFEVSALLEINLDIDFDEIEIDPEKEESYFKKPTQQEIKGKSRFGDKDDLER